MVQGFERDYVNFLGLWLDINNISGSKLRIDKVLKICNTMIKYVNAQ